MALTLTYSYSTVHHPILLYVVSYRMLYESTNCIYSAPTGRTVLVRVLKEGMANLPTVKPWNTPP